MSAEMKLDCEIELIRRLLISVENQLYRIEGKVDTLMTMVQVDQDDLNSLIASDASLDAKVTALAAYVKTLTNPASLPDDSAQLKAVLADVNAQVTALAALVPPPAAAQVTPTTTEAPPSATKPTEVAVAAPTGAETNPPTA